MPENQDNGMRALVVQPTDTKQVAYIDLYAPETHTIIIFSLLAGFARYVYSTMRDKGRLNILGFLAHGAVSVVAAFIAANLTVWAGISSPNLKIAVIGLSGWAGPQAMDFIEALAKRYIVKKMGFEEEQKEENKDAQ